MQRAVPILHIDGYEEATTYYVDNPAGVMCYVDVDDLDALIAEWKVRRPDFTQGVEITPWNANNISLKGPFGNTLGIN